MSTSLNHAHSSIRSRISIVVSNLTEAMGASDGDDVVQFVNNAIRSLQVASDEYMLADKGEGPGRDGSPDDDDDNRFCSECHADIVGNDPHDPDCSEPSTPLIGGSGDEGEPCMACLGHNCSGGCAY
jgi:hypothetical protein